ncbi:MAG: ADP-ribosylglycohydrolase family protein [Acidobacteriota bacterium]|nr:ADP-ribosylglycohydrolase family protein [Acidobacteriota bacterium]
MNLENQSSTWESTPHVARERAVVQSALWAATGDALGWITELSHGLRGVVRRTGVSRITKPVAWKRIIGGRGGPRVNLLAGTYSDDTQIRLAVARSIRGDGSFDVEAFAKVELTVWPTYALGAGLGTKTAAVSLSRRSVNWYSNFYNRGGKKYTDSGGNGAAMRIQPHVWSSSSGGDSLIVDVLRDAIVTHGHPHGFCGAIFHALCLEDAFRKRELPRPEEWAVYIDRFLDLPRLVAEEPQLAAFWKPAWETSAGVSLSRAVTKIRDDGLRDLEFVTELKDSSPVEGYKQIVRQLGCLKPQFRGSGLKTALAAIVLAYLFRNFEVEDALQTAVNELESDTDTIATMGGALLGVISRREPDWPLQDHSYIVSEAKRLAAISRGQHQDSFTYPDLGNWDPPARQNSSIGWFNGKLAIAGLGPLTSVGTEYASRDAVWQWFELPFGQTILAKRKSNLQDRIVFSQLPDPRQRAETKRDVTTTRSGNEPRQKGLAFQDRRSEKQAGKLGRDSPSQRSNQIHRGTVDSWTDDVISSGFDDYTLGKSLNYCIDQTRSVDSAIGFAAIIAKAKLARQRKRR